MHTNQAKKHIFLSFFIMLASTGTAWAHTGADSGHDHGAFVDGLLHPLTGTDHLAAMVAVGIWSAVALRTVWQAPLAFVAMLTLGALAGFSGIHPPGVESAVAASIMVLGLLISWRKGFPLGGVVSLVGVFAFFHGVAHGTELAGGAQLAALTGMVVTTAGLHVVGVGMGRLVLAHQHRVRQALGATLTMLGTWLLMQSA